MQFVILSGIGIIGDHYINSFGWRSTECTDKENQFHKIIINWSTSGLDQINIFSSDIIKDLNINELT